jgi:apolipoprotein N-acyltransferase
MTSTPRQLAIAIAAIFLSAVAFYFGTGLHPVWLLTWFAPIPVLLVAPRLSRPAAFAVAFLAWVGGGINVWNSYIVVLQIPVLVAIVATALPALLFGFDVLLYRRFLSSSAVRAAVVFPSFWVFCEFVSASFSPHGTFGNLGYTQMNFPPILQIASVTGIWGISFCLFLFAATLSVLLSYDVVLKERQRLGIAVGIVLAVILGFGYWRLDLMPSRGQTVMVGLVASDLRQNILTEKPDDTIRLMYEYAAQAQKLAAQGAQVVVVPEKISVVEDSNLAAVDTVFASTARQTGASIVIGVIHPTSSARWNEARLYSPAGTIRTYEKHHMLPPFESDLTVGTSRTVWQEPSGVWGIEICKDMDFPRLSREYGNDDVGLLLVPAWDFGVDGWLHGRMAILRGVESGFSIARAPKQGLLTISDDRGRVIAEHDSATAPFTSLVVAVPVWHQTTLYTRFGNWFAWLNVALLALLFASRARSERRGVS